MHRIRDGFTIVELLIVIVVIAILATISVVAFTGVQNRANDAAVKSDVRNLAHALHAYELENQIELYSQLSNSSSINSTPAFRFIPNKSAHSSQYALYVCRADAERSNFVVASRSASGNIFAYKVGQGFIDYPQQHSNVWGTGATNCPRMLGLPGSPTSAWRYTYGTGSGTTWSPWARE